MKKIITFILTFFLFTLSLNAIENITINNYDLAPRFDKDIKVYNVYTSINTEIITINVIQNEGKTITGNGSKSLKKGVNKFEINSYLNNELAKTYTIFVTRGEEADLKDDAHLESVSISNKDIDFESDKFIYYIDNTSNLDIDYNPRNTNSYVTLKTNVTKETEEITIKVVSENKKNTNTYKFIVKKDLQNEKSDSKKSIFDTKKFDEVDLKIIRIIIITFVLIVLGIIFYFMFIKKRSNKDLYISHSILRK